eukprot:1582143-Alexandrium_andersonii.AAC.1
MPAPRACRPRPMARIFSSQGVQSAIRNPPKAVRAPIRLNPQSAMRNMKTRSGHLELELRGPGNGLKIGPRSFRWCVLR